MTWPRRLRLRRLRTSHDGAWWCWHVWRRHECMGTDRRQRRIWVCSPCRGRWVSLVRLPHPDWRR